MKKIATRVLNNPLQPGTYPVNYNGIKVGTAIVEGDSVLMTINTTDEDEDKQKILTKLVQKLESKKASVSSVGEVEYDVINNQAMLEAGVDCFFINDLPEYIQTEPINDVPGPSPAQ